VHEFAVMECFTQLMLREALTDPGNLE
jgi:hypothetical protein